MHPNCCFHKPSNRQARDLLHSIGTDEYENNTLQDRLPPFAVLTRSCAFGSDPKPDLYGSYKGGFRH